MSNSNSSNKAAVPEAKSALNRFKYEVANGQKDDRGSGKTDVQRRKHAAVLISGPIIYPCLFSL